VPDANIGNSIFFLQDIVPYNFQNKYIIDLYQFNYYYINEQSAGAVQIGSKTNYMDLIKFQSKPYASYQQLNQAQSDLSSEDWNDLTDALVANGIIYAVDLNAADITTTFYQISGNSLNGQSGHNIQKERAAPVIPLIRGAKATGNVRYSVAYNTAADFDIFQQVPKFSTDTSIPFGFEVLLIGSTAARQVTMRLVLAAGLQRQIRSLANDVTVHARYF